VIGYLTTLFKIVIKNADYKMLHLELAQSSERDYSI
jgi:hypothetical protein